MMMIVVRFNIVFALLLIFNLTYAKDLDFGKKNNLKFENSGYLQNTRIEKGADGSSDVVLMENEYTFDQDMDLLLHFNETNNQWTEISKSQKNDNNRSPYSLEKKNIELDKKIKVFGSSSAKFASLQSTLVLKPNKDSWFNRANHAGSFTIEFWLNPSLLSNDEVVFKKFGPVVEDGRIANYSGIKCRIMNRRLNWEFHHIFHSPAFSDDTQRESDLVEITGHTRLQKNQWSHHAIAFDSITGKMTYYIDGKVEKNIFVTTSGQPQDTVLSPRFYPQEKSMLIIGDKYYGFIDEFVISKICKEPRSRILTGGNGIAKPYFRTQKYRLAEGQYVSNVFPLDQSGSYLKNVVLNVDEKNGAGIVIQYRIREKYFYPQDDPDKYWQTLDLHQMRFGSRKITGKYFQWRAILNSGQSGEASPVLKDISFNFVIDEKPLAPTNLVAFSSEGKVFLRWLGNVESDISQYKIYYGYESNNYFINGKDPLSITVSQLSDKIRPAVVLDNDDINLNKTYFFVVTAVDKNGHESEISNEVFVRVRQYK